MADEIDWLDEYELDHWECDTLSMRKLISAIFTEALGEAALSVHWADFISEGIEGSHTLPLYNTAIHFLAAHESLSSFSRSRYATELLDWLQSFSEQVEAEEYWMKLDNHLEDSRHAIPLAIKVVERGAPPQ